MDLNEFEIRAAQGQQYGVGFVLDERGGTSEGREGKKGIRKYGNDAVR
jgi:hypothetical protein